jgi:hypothetical protein
MSDIMGAFNQATGLTDDPAKNQKEAAQAAQAWQEKMWRTTRKDMKPWLESGKSNLATLNSAMQPGGTLDPNARFQFSQDDPSYKWRTQQGIDAIRAGGAGTNLGSGNMGTALVNYGQGAASQEYGNAFNRYEGERAANYNMLAAASNPQSVMQMGNFNMQSGANIGNTIQSGAMNQMAGQQMQSGNLQGAIGSAFNMGKSLYDMYQQNQMQNQGWNQFQGQASNNFGYSPVDYGVGGVSQGADMYAGDLWA